MNLPVPSPFFNSRADRLELARTRYFEEGITPVGVVQEAIFHSWARCQRLHNHASAEVTFQPVTASRTHLALQRSRLLLQAWHEELPSMESVLSTTSCAAMLTDASGLLVGASCAGRSHEKLMPVATRLGVDLSEEAVGTTAPGIVARTGQAHTVLGGEHFFVGVKAMHCAAAPIRDADGRLAGVLDISSETLPFGFDAPSVVGLFAGALENRLLVSQSTDHLVLRLQVAPALLDTPMAGLIGIGSNGQLAWINGVAAKLLGLPETDQGLKRISAESALGMPPSALTSIVRIGAEALRLRNGLQVWVRADMKARDGHQQLHALGRCQSTPLTNASNASAPLETLEPEAALAMPTPDEPAMAEGAAAGTSTLRDADRDLILRTLTECRGNIAKAAKQLGVSRGLIYRRVKSNSVLAN